MNYILVGKNGRPSLRAVSLHLVVPHVVLMRKKYRRTGYIRWFKLVNFERNAWVGYLPINNNPTFTNDDVVLRWGFAGQLDTGHAKVYQEAHSIDLISNKAEARIIMARANIAVPKTSYRPTDLQYPIIARPTHHSRGRNFLLCQNIEELPNHVLNGQWYFSEVYPKTEEYRVHVAHGKVLIVHKKPLTDDMRGNRAVTHGQWEVVNWSDYKKYICLPAIEAVKAVGADCGGVDVLVNPRHEPKAVVCEINAAPTIKSSEYTVTRYAEYFDWLFKQKRQWYDYAPWTVGRSFAFTHWQLRDGQQEDSGDER